MRYKLIKQEPYCCVPRCLQMIFNRNNILYDSQMMIAQELGLKVDGNYRGTQVQNYDYSIDKYLKVHNIPLTFKYVFNLNYNEVKELLDEFKDDDIMVCYKRGVMFGKELMGGHATIIDQIKGDVVTLIYPEDDKGYRDVSLESLLDAIKRHGRENMAGFWLFSKKNNLYYELKKSDVNDVDRLIEYKKRTIYQYAGDLSDDEVNKINSYIEKGVLSLLDNYFNIIVDDKIVGCLLLTDKDDGKLLDEIYLEVGYRNRGIGSDIIRNIINENDIVYLWVYKKNFRAISLYDSFGFNILEETESRYYMKYSKCR